MHDGMIVDATIARTKLDALPTGTMYVELMCQCDIDGQAALVPVKLWVTDKAADGTRKHLAALGFRDMANIAALNTGESTPLAGVGVKIALKETKWGIQGEMPSGGGMDANRMAKMAAMLGGGGVVDGGDIPF